MTRRLACARPVRLLTSLALAGGTALALALGAQGSAAAGAAGTERQVIATAESNGFRIEVTAIREPVAGGADTATVRIAAFERSGGSWQRVGRALRVGRRSGWFWNVVTRPYGVRRLTLYRPGGELGGAALRLLISPSIGPSDTYYFQTFEGRLEAVYV